MWKVEAQLSEAIPEEGRRRRRKQNPRLQPGDGPVDRGPREMAAVWAPSGRGDGCWEAGMSHYQAEGAVEQLERGRDLGAVSCREWK